MPYKGFETFLPENAYKDSKIWSACVALICFPVVVWHQTNKVMLQFGLCQDIPNPSHNLDQVYYIDMSGHSGTNWAEKYQWWIAIWNERDKHVLIGQPILGKIEHMSHYMNWYRANSKICLTQFTTHPNVAATSCSASNMETEQHPLQQTSRCQHAWWRTTTTCSIIWIHATTSSSLRRLWVQSSVL